jgi:pyruvate dehydrogenase E2 component (dihydrolipoamide acetyltransferase)
MRRVTAERLSQSHLTAAHVTITNEVDVTEMVKLRQAMLQDIQKTAGVRISYNDMIVRAVAKALREHPSLNATLEGEEVKMFQDIHMGVAITLEQGLMVLVIRDADKKSLVEISVATKELAERAKQGTSSFDDVSGSTFTITNLGMFGAEIFTPIINPPECAILGVGRIVEKPAVIGGQIVVRSMMHLNLSFDHRIVDGAPAAEFMQRVKEILENPNQLLT